MCTVRRTFHFCIVFLSLDSPAFHGADISVGITTGQAQQCKLDAIDAELALWEVAFAL